MIHVIHPDYQHYKSFVFDSKEVRKSLGNESQFHFSRAPQRYLDSWHPFEISFANLGSSKKTAVPDIIVRNGRLFFTIAAYDTLHKLIEPQGEFLPVTYEGKDGYLFNVLSLAEDVDGVDKKLSTKNEFGEVQSLSFNEAKVKDFALFRTGFDGYMGIYCNDKLKAAIEENKFKGITFSNDIGNIFPPDEKATQQSKH